MADIESTGFISLADLASMDTDEIKTLTSRVPAPGVFRVKGASVLGKQGDPTDDGKPGLYRFTFGLEIMGGKPVDKNLDIETLIGKKLNQMYTIWPADLIEGIGLLKGMYQKIGLPNSGMPMGGVEGQEPGWLDGITGAEFDVRIRNGTVKGETRAFYDWLPPAKEEAATEGATA